MGPVVRTVHECLDVLGEKMSTTITGDAWDGATFELTDAGGGMSGTLDGALHSALHASREAGAGLIRLGCTLRLSGVPGAASLTLRSPATSFAPRIELHAPLPRGAGAADAWVAHSGGAGASLQLRWRERLSGAAAVQRELSAAAAVTLSADVALGRLLPDTALGAEWRSAEPRVARLRARHTRPEGARLGGVYVSAEARLSPDERFTRRKDLRLLIGRRFLLPSDAEAEAAEAAKNTSSMNKQGA